MMVIDRNKTYTHQGYSYKNYVTLSEEEKLMILEWRNHPDIRKLMTTNEPIVLENHLAFIESLKNRTDRYYWVVYKENRPIGMMSISDIDNETKTCEPGYYLCPDMLDSGIGLEFHYNYKGFIFNVLGFERTNGYVITGNTSAYILATFFGSRPNGVLRKASRVFVTMSLSKDDFNSVPTENLQRQFAIYLRQNRKVDWDNLLTTLE